MEHLSISLVRTFGDPLGLKVELNFQNLTHKKLFSLSILHICLAFSVLSLIESITYSMVLYAFPSFKQPF